MNLYFQIAQIQTSLGIAKREDIFVIPEEFRNICFTRSSSTQLKCTLHVPILIQIGYGFISRIQYKKHK